MNSHANEDLMWERLKDLQLEAENARLRARPVRGRRQLLGVARRALWTAGHALGVVPRWWTRDLA